MTGQPLLQIHGLKVAFGESAREVVSGINFEIRKGETLAIVGESGSGKSVTALAIMGLLGRSGGRVTSGEISFAGRSLLNLAPEDLRRVRGEGIGMVFQEPMTSLNPVLPIGLQLTEALVSRGIATASEARARAVEMLRKVSIADPDRKLGQYLRTAVEN